MKNNQYKCSSATKQKLISTITFLSIEKGYQNVTVRDICKKSGISNGSFYHHYISKESLARDAYLTIDLILSDTFIDHCNSLPPLNGLYTILETYVKYISQEVGLAIKEYYKILLNGENIELFDKKRPYYLILSSQIKRCIDDGYFDERLGIDFLTDFIVKFLRGCIFDWAIQNGNYDLIKQLKTEFNVFVKSLF